MKLSGFKEAYQVFSAKASDVSRQLAFAGIAVVWIFKTGDAGNPKVPGELIPPLICLSCALACDLLQYVMQAMIWGIFHRLKEKTHKENEDILAPRVLNWPPLVMFSIKVILVILGYTLLVLYLNKRMV